mgnify:CR=1 FL=1
MSIIIPTMNEEENIGKVIERIRKSVIGNYEILIVDNSTDRTPDIARSMGARVIEEKRKGYGRAYKTGFSNASGKIIVTLDGDNTYPPEVINDYIDILYRDNYDFISCERISRLSPEAMVKAHRIGNLILNYAVLMLFFLKIKDSQSGMWIFRKEILYGMNLCSDGMPFSEELKIQAFTKFRSKELPIDYGVRMGEVKLQRFKDGVKNLLYLLKIRFFRCNEKLSIKI